MANCIAKNCPTNYYSTCMHLSYVIFNDSCKDICFFFYSISSTKLLSNHPLQHMLESTSISLYTVSVHNTFELREFFQLIPLIICSVYIISMLLKKRRRQMKRNWPLINQNECNAHKIIDLACMSTDRCQSSISYAEPNLAKSVIYGLFVMFCFDAYNNCCILWFNCSTER